MGFDKYKVNDVDYIFIPDAASQLGPNNVIATENLTIYADVTNGNDANDGLTPATAVQTWDKGVFLVPPGYRKSLTVQFAPGVYPIDRTASDIAGIYVSNPIGGLPTEMIFNGGYTDVGLGARTETDAGNGEFVKDGTLVIPVNAYRGDMVQILTGANAGQNRKIISNTVDGKFFVNSPFNSPVSIGDTFVIQKPSVTWHVDGGLSFLGSSQARFAIAGINIEFTPGFAFIQVGVNTSLQMAGCTVDLTGSFGVFMGHNCELICQGGLSGETGFSNGAHPLATVDSQNGVYFKSTDLFPNSIGTGSYGNFTGSCVFDNLQLAGGEHSLIDLLNPSGKKFEVFAPLQSLVNIEGGETNGFTTVRAVLDTDASGFGTPVVQVSENSTLKMTGTDIENGSGNAISVDDVSSAKIFDVGGTTSAGAGLHAGHMSKILIDDGGSPTTVTGGAGNTLIGTTPATYVAINGAGGITDGFENRIEPMSSP